jgi:hypothetical protein
MQNSIEPLNPTEFEELNHFITDLGAYIPENKVGYVWGMYNKLNGTNETQPCTCSSAAGHWRRAVDYLHKFVKDRV